MQQLSEIKYVYFIGIGGIGMSAIGRWFLRNGRKVAGYDRTETILTKQLANEGMEIHYEDNIHYIPADFLENPQKTLVIYTPAVPSHHTELSFFKEKGFLVRKRAEVLGIISKGMSGIGVAGTHGKTTTSTLTAHILKHGGVDTAAFLGGISVNYGSNLLLNEKISPQTPAVIEADEFDRSFLHLFPHIAIITSTDADHLDIYGHHDSVKESFAKYASQVQKGGSIFINSRCDAHIIEQIDKEVNVFFYNLHPQEEPFTQHLKPHIWAENVHIQNGRFYFDYVSPWQRINAIEMNVAGFHNIENALAAISVALQYAVSPTHIKEAIATFRGIKRRFEYILQNEKITYIDDYAHHPTEINAFLRSVKELYPTQKIMAIFQPHLFSRTRDFVDGFAQSLEIADFVVLMDIYPARELPIENINSGIILEKIKNPNKIWIQNKDLLHFIRNSDCTIFLTIGAGDIDTFIQPIKDILVEKSFSSENA